MRNVGRLKLYIKHGWLVVALVMLGLLMQACNETPTPAPTPTLPPADNTTKIDTVLMEMFVKYSTTQGSEQDKQKAVTDYATDQGWINNKDEVTFEIELDDASYYQQVSDKITSMGGHVMGKPDPNAPVPMTKMRVAVPESTFISYLNSSNNQANFLRDLADFKGVKAINVISTHKTSDLTHLPQTTTALAAFATQTKNEGVKIMGVDKWQAAGFTGKGVIIGIIDEGFKYYQQFLGTTLPSNLQIRDEDAQEGGDGMIDADVHGTAVLEIIHSLAPDATLLPIAVDGSEEEEAGAFAYLKSQNAQILSMSLGGHATPGDGSLSENQRVDQLRASGILPIIAAGNEGDSHYGALFNPDPQGYQQFEPGVIKMAVGNPDSVSLTTEVILNWEQWHLTGGVKPNDLDLFVEDQNGKTIASSQNDQRSRPPIEAIHIKVPPRTLYYIKVRLKPGTPKPSQPFRLHIFTRDLPLQFDTPAMSVADPGDSKGALTVGAVQFDKDVIAYYSSRGPLPDGRMKPDISAPAGVSSAAYALEGQDGFDGTSAATPETAGVAAVLKSANPSLTADQLAELLEEYTKKLNGKGNPDNNYGYGRVDLTNVQPGNANPKNNLGPAPTPNNNPVLTPTVSDFYPTPVVTPGMGKTNQTTTNNVTASASKTNQTTTDVATAGPTPTAIPTPQSIGPVIFSDTFNSDQSGLPNGEPTTYGHNLYEVKPAANQLAWGAYPASQSVSDFAGEVSVNGIRDGSGIYGLIFWQSSASDYYMLSVTGDGKASVQHFKGGGWQTVIDWIAVPNWKAGAANQIGVTAHAGSLNVLINGMLVKSGQGQGNGPLGFAAGSYSGALDATFQNFSLSTSK